MPEIIRTRDCTVHMKGDAYPVSISPAMMAGGWSGGQGVQWADSPRDEFMVTYSDGLYGGFLLWGSDEASDGWVALTGSQPRYGYAILCAGGWLISTSTFEQYTYTSRTMGGPLVPLVYTSGVRVVFSLRGRFTVEDEWTLSGDPRGANSYFIASVVQPPMAANNNRLVLQTSI